MTSDDRDPHANPDPKAEAARRAAEEPSIGSLFGAVAGGVLGGVAASGMSTDAGGTHAPGSGPPRPRSGGRPT